MAFLNTKPVELEGLEVLELRYVHQGDGVYVLSDESKETLPEDLVKGVMPVYHTRYVHSFQLSVVFDLDRLRRGGSYKYLWHETKRSHGTSTTFYVQKI